MTCIEFTRNIAVTQAQGGETFSVERNMTLLFSSLQEDDDDSKDDCQVSSHGELRLVPEESPDSPPLMSSSNVAWYATWHNARLLLKVDVDVDISVGFDESLGTLDIGVNLLGLKSAPHDPSVPPVTRGFVVNNLHLVSNCAGGVITVSSSL